MIKDGILNINKPSGMTSHDVVSKLRRRLGIKRIGHTGTLDPMATGVLPVCIGKATRIIEYYDADLKSYHAVMKLGTVTDSMDSTGNVISTCSYESITEENVISAAAAFDGYVTQTPPIYSALKVDGKRLYEYAREGKSVDIKSREVYLEGMKVTSIDLSEGVIEFDISCSKGTYIRSIIDDMGKALGCGAMMTALERTRSGYFGLEDALWLEDALSMDDEELESHIIQPADSLVNLGAVELAAARLKAFCNGMSSHQKGYRVTKKEGKLPGYRVYCKGEFYGIAVIEEGELIPEKVIVNN